MQSAAPAKSFEKETRTQGGVSERWTLLKFCGGRGSPTPEWEQRHCFGQGGPGPTGIGAPDADDRGMQEYLADGIDPVGDGFQDAPLLT